MKLIKRYIIEFGLGMDFHGQDVNKAAHKAVLDAISKSCLCGLKEVLGIKDMNKDIVVNVILSTTQPEKIDKEKIKTYLPVGEVKVQSVSGGLNVPGIFIPEFGDSDNSIEVAIACIEVYIK
ncbi:Lin0512 family protein [Clostridium botulinum]|nr:Lin0512 family protein [Clostridium botulinum]MCR1975719.1 Lin0512 family protein [Clostridium sporogenes]MBD5638705.1 Lin0512 family protein [Clostridium botulinum]MCC5428792.1 Lin0512 family protein [Clostridium botulinum]MCR1145777.1 Lin0512 family protein [Clostridium botulinum]MCW6079605.1 Lin0512 family protein [Clostridium sporogenes]